MNNLTIRPFQPEDEQSVIALWQRCGLTRPWNDPHKDIQRKRAVQGEWFLIGLRDGRIVASAMAGYDGHRGWVNYLAVAPEHQRSGLGRELMEHIETLLREAGCPKINLQVRGSNEAALEFYRRIGYLPDEVISLGKRLIPDETASHRPAGESKT